MEELNYEKTENVGANVGEIRETEKRKKFKIISHFLKTAWSNKPVRIIICCVVACAIILTGFFIWKNNFSMEAIAKKGAVAYQEYDIEEYGKYLAVDATDYLKVIYNYSDPEKEEFFETVSLIYDEQIDSWDELIDIMHEERQYSLEDAYGPYKLSATVRKVRKYSVRKILSLTDDALAELCDGGNSVSKGCVVTVKVSIDGEYDSDSVTVTANMVKIDGKWKIIEMDTDKKE